IPTDINGQVFMDEKGTLVPGCYAAGEAACVSVHGANRLGTNSLLDLVVFGKRAGLAMAEYCATAGMPQLPADPTGPITAEFERLLAQTSGEPAAKIREEMQNTMMDFVGVFREQAGIQKAVDKVRELQDRYRTLVIMDKGRRYNLEMLEAWELGSLLELAEVTAESALARTESRGAHSREDFPDRDDANWLKHTFAYRREGGRIELRYKPVTITRFQPKERVY
ncbi:MAG: FAD-binding protein, partial [Gemmatimonadetes bacterium]|nr:FAD-binding protein [Gemmatimonadota bacterium]